MTKLIHPNFKQWANFRKFNPLGYNWEKFIIVSHSFDNISAINQTIPELIMNPFVVFVKLCNTSRPYDDLLSIRLKFVKFQTLCCEKNPAIFLA